MSEEQQKPAPRVGEEGLGGRMGFFIGLAFLCALALAGAYFAYQFYTSTGQNPASLTVTTPAAQHPHP